MRPSRALLGPGAVLAAVLVCLACAGCGSEHHGAGNVSGPVPGPRPAPAAGPALGITEDNAQLLLASGPAEPRWASSGQAFVRARRQLAALRPAYVRLLVDWAALQPRAEHPADLAAPVSGCARTVGPCAAYPGLKGELEAIASERRARRAAGESGPEVLIDVLGVPPWAAAPAAGCEPEGAPSDARALAPGAIAGYRALIGSLAALGASEGVPLRRWSPWNEPNDPTFLAPQRERCEAAAAPVAPAVYAQLARAMAAQLRLSDPGAAIVLGELNGLTRGSARATSLQSFVAALPADVLCLGSAWSVHAYATYGSDAAGTDPVAALQAALRERGGCAAGAPVWITEAGAGAPHPGAAGGASPAQQLQACRALASQLQGWQAEPRVAAVFQYTFRDDPAFPVGLVSADLRTLHPVYGLWLSLARRRADGAAPGPPYGACGETGLSLAGQG